MVQLGLEELNGLDAIRYCMYVIEIKNIIFPIFYALFSTVVSITNCSKLCYFEIKNALRKLKLKLI